MRYLFYSFLPSQLIQNKCKNNFLSKITLLLLIVEHKYECTLAFVMMKHFWGSSLDCPITSHPYLLNTVWAGEKKCRQLWLHFEAYRF